jgi:hypothetical protein
MMKYLPRWYINKLFCFAKKFAKIASLKERFVLNFRIFKKCMPPAKPANQFDQTVLTFEAWCKFTQGLRRDKEEKRCEVSVA